MDVTSEGANYQMPCRAAATICDPPYGILRDGAVWVDNDDGLTDRHVILLTRKPHLELHIDVQLPHQAWQPHSCISMHSPPAVPRQQASSVSSVVYRYTTWRRVSTWRFLMLPRCPHRMLRSAGNHSQDKYNAAARLIDSSTDPHGLVLIFMHDKQAPIWDKAFKEARPCTAKPSVVPLAFFCEELPVRAQVDRTRKLLLVVHDDSVGSMAMKARPSEPSLQHALHLQSGI